MISIILDDGKGIIIGPERIEKMLGRNLKCTKIIQIKQHYNRILSCCNIDDTVDAISNSNDKSYACKRRRTI